LVQAFETALLAAQEREVALQMAVRSLTERAALETATLEARVCHLSAELEQMERRRRECEADREELATNNVEASVPLLRQVRGGPHCMCHAQPHLTGIWNMMGTRYCATEKESYEAGSLMAVIEIFMELPPWVFIFLLGYGQEGPPCQSSNLKNDISEKSVRFLKLIHIFDAPNMCIFRVWYVQDLDRFCGPDPRLRNVMFQV
jgi:hypothetical protein